MCAGNVGCSGLDSMWMATKMNPLDQAAVAISVSRQSKKSYLVIALAPCADSQQQNAQDRRPRTRATESGPTLVLIHSTWHPLLMSSSHAEVKTTTVIKGKTALRWTRTRTSARKVKVTSRPRCRRSTLSFWSPGSKSFCSPSHRSRTRSGK